MFFHNVSCDLIVGIKDYIVFRRVIEQRSTIVLTSCNITVTAQFRLQYSVNVTLRCTNMYFYEKK